MASRGNNTAELLDKIFCWTIETGSLRVRLRLELNVD